MNSIRKKTAIISGLLVCLLCVCLKLNKVPFKHKKSNKYKEHTVSGPTKLSVKIANNIIKNGGNAIDAIAGMQAAIDLTETHASGLGGGGYLIYFDKKSNKLFSFDGRETAPKDAKSIEVFEAIRKNREYMSTDNNFYGLVFSPKLIAVPGNLKLIHKAHSLFGSAKWSDLFKETIYYAENGFYPEERLVSKYNIVTGEDMHPRPNDIKKLFSLDKNGKSTRQEFADLLKKISQTNGVDDFYKGDIARSTVEKLQKEYGSWITYEDFANYDVLVEEPMCIEYKTYKICTTHKNFTVLMALKLLEEYDFSKIKNYSEVQMIKAFSNAIDIGMANNNKYSRYDKSLKIDFNDLIKNALNEYAGKVVGEREIFKPMALDALKKNGNDKDKLYGTSSFMAIDKEGNIGLMTSSVNSYFGSGVLVNGIILNNTMMDFSDCKNCSNAIAGGKRPVSSISPVIVFDNNGNPVFGASSAGGGKIFSYVASTILQMLEFDKGPQEAINSVKTHSNNKGVISIESRYPEVLISMQKNNINVRQELDVSGLVGFKIGKQCILAGHDERRGGYDGGY